MSSDPRSHSSFEKTADYVGPIPVNSPSLDKPLNPNRGQIGSYTSDQPSLPYDPEQNQFHKGWLPVPLRTWFSVSLLIVMALGALILEVLWNSNRVSNGWAANGKLASETGWQHYLFTLPPVIIAMAIAAMWAWTDVEVKRMQPYVELFGHNGASPQKSLLLDYTRTHNFWVWVPAMTNRHFIVAITTSIVLCCLALQPLAAALITVKDTPWAQPAVTVNNLAAISLNQNSAFQDLTTFLTSAGYASASAMFNLSDPPFTNKGFAVSTFEIPSISSDYVNGFASVNTSAVLTDPGCRAADSVNYNKRADGTGWDNNAIFGSCQFNWSVNKTTTNLFGADLATNCSEFTNTPAWFQPIIYWAFTYSPSARGSIAMCQPSISLWDVNLEMELSTKNIVSVTKIRPFVQGTSNYSSFAGNITGAPLNGQAYNGIRFNLSGSGDSDPFIQQREQSIQFALPGAIFQALQNKPEGLFAALGDSSMVELSSQVYTTYLSLVALETYFVASVLPMSVDLTFTRKRIWFTPLATHLLAADFLVVFFLGLFVLIYHRPSRRLLRLRYQPGTIAAAVSMVGESALGSVLAGVQREEDLSTSLQDKKFRLNPATMKIIMEGEDGYDEVSSPPPVPVSMQEKMAGVQRRMSRRIFKQ